jgi:phosphoenolpyruvate-protein kinase (PTS system EI component)
MDANTILFWATQALLGGLGLVLWTNLRDVKATAEGNAKALADHKLHAAENYVTQSDLTRAIDALSRGIDAVFKKLDRIEEKIDMKQDKPRS